MMKHKYGRTGKAGRFLACCLIAAGVLTGCGSNKTEDPLLENESIIMEQHEQDTFPVSWTHRKNGTILLDVQGAIEDSQVWSVNSDQEEIVSVEITDAGKKKTSCSLQAIGTGSAWIELLLGAEEQEELVDYRIRMLVSAEDSGELYLLQVTSEAIGGTYDAERRYRCDLKSSGNDFRVTITPTAEDPVLQEMTSEDWVISDYNADIVTISGPYLTETGIQFQMQGGTEGKTVCTLSCIELNLTIELSVQTNEMGSISVSGGITS